MSDFYEEQISNLEEYIEELEAELKQLRGENKMDMLTNRVRFDLLTKDEQQMFRDAGKAALLYYNGYPSEWIPAVNTLSFTSSSVYRLKPEPVEKCKGCCLCCGCKVTADDVDPSLFSNND